MWCARRRAADNRDGGDSAREQTRSPRSRCEDAAMRAESAANRGKSATDRAEDAAARAETFAAEARFQAIPRTPTICMRAESAATRAEEAAMRAEQAARFPGPATAASLIPRTPAAALANSGARLPPAADGFHGGDPPAASASTNDDRLAFAGDSAWRWGRSSSWDDQSEEEEGWIEDNRRG